MACVPSTRRHDDNGFPEETAKMNRVIGGLFLLSVATVACTSEEETDSLEFHSASPHIPDRPSPAQECYNFCSKTEESCDHDSFEHLKSCLESAGCDPADLWNCGNPKAVACESEGCCESALCSETRHALDDYCDAQFPNPGPVMQKETKERPSPEQLNACETNFPHLFPGDTDSGTSTSETDEDGSQDDPTSETGAQDDGSSRPDLG
jgi:hypothetical protein